MKPPSSNILILLNIGMLLEKEISLARQIMESSPNGIHHLLMLLFNTNLKPKVKQCVQVVIVSGNDRYQIDRINKHIRKVFNDI